MERNEWGHGGGPMKRRSAMTVRLRTFSCASLALGLVAATGLLAQQGQLSTSPKSTSTETMAEVKSLAQSLNQAMAQPVFQERAARYKLRAGDVLQIDFERIPAFNQVQTIQPDGYIQLQNLGDFQAAGKTIPEVTEALTRRYEKILREPLMTVTLKDFEHPYFIASGEVIRPGKYDLWGVTTATQAIAMAGGTNAFAKRSHVLLFRRVSEDYVKIKELNLKKMLGRGNLREDVELQPGDLIFVPKSVTASILTSLLPHTSTGLYLPFKVD